MHFKATILKRIRVSRRDIKFFVFSLLIPFLVILFGLLLLKVSFFVEFNPRAVTVDTYLTEENPVFIPLASDSTSNLMLMNNVISNLYR
jgi:hypothetical protein